MDYGHQNSQYGQAPERVDSLNAPAGFDANADSREQALSRLKEKIDRDYSSYGSMTMESAQNVVPGLGQENQQNSFQANNGEGFALSENSIQIIDTMQPEAVSGPYLVSFDEKNFKSDEKGLPKETERIVLEEQAKFERDKDPNDYYQKAQGMRAAFIEDYTHKKIEGNS